MPHGIIIFPTTGYLWKTIIPENHISPLAIIDMTIQQAAIELVRRKVTRCRIVLLSNLRLT